MSASSAAAQPAPASMIVGPNIMGAREEYQLIKNLQSALFGGVYEARGLSSNRDYAIKVLHKSEMARVQETSSIEFCEVPLSELKFAKVMAGCENVMEAMEHFEDSYCHYCVFDLARGGDLLEALKQKPQGFQESHAQYYIKQAAKGLAFMHGRRVAMQDVSLENMLLCVNESTGNFQVKICDPGQAVHFEVSATGEEQHVGFRGLVGKSFRPPELHEQRSYLATKVDSWCLGWSTFYLLTAQPLFMVATAEDPDWVLFRHGNYKSLFERKKPAISDSAWDFIIRLLTLDPTRRMSVADCIEHPWLAGDRVPPVRAPMEILPENLRRAIEQRDQESTGPPLSR